jgi:NAD(P)-dependent dehydrogenase (short-subunit alcohol dehydrogenase family)
MKLSTATGVMAAAAAGAFLLTKAIRQSNYNLKDKVVMITGGSRGLGLVLARDFARRGAKLVICARTEVELERARDDLRSRGAEVLACRCDVTINAEVVEMVQLAHDTFGRIDVLVNNAGVIQAGPLEVMTREDFDRAMKVHFWGPLNTVLNVLPEMRGRKEGRIINISSVGGKLSVPHLVPYGASKFALVGLSKGLHAELKKDGIIVTTVCPGLMRTGSPKNADFKGRHRAEYAWFSIGDSLPCTSINAERAAEQIIDASVSGRAELIISIQAKAAVLFDSLFPELSAELFAATNRLLPGPGGIGKAQAKGSESTSAWSPSWLTQLTEEAAARNNEN